MLHPKLNKELIEKRKPLFYLIRSEFKVNFNTLNCGLWSNLKERHFATHHNRHTGDLPWSGNIANELPGTYNSSRLSHGDHESPQILCHFQDHTYYP
jgi:hypothetical protein